MEKSLFIGFEIKYSILIGLFLTIYFIGTAYYEILICIRLTIHFYSESKIHITVIFISYRCRHTFFDCQRIRIGTGSIFIDKFTPYTRTVIYSTIVCIGGRLYLYESVIIALADLIATPCHDTGKSCYLTVFQIKFSAVFYGAVFIICGIYGFAVL